MNTSLSVTDYLKQECGAVYDEIAHVWTDDVLPELARFGAWGMGITKNILHDLQGVVVNGEAVAEQLTGAALKQIFNTVIAQVKIAATSGSSFGEKIIAVRDAIFSTVNFGTLWPIAQQIGYSTFTSMITGFLSMAMAGAL